MSGFVTASASQSFFTDGARLLFTFPREVPMSLRFDYSRVAPEHRSLFITGPADAEKFTALGEVLPFMAMVVGMTRINSKSADEFYARVSLVEKLNGAFRRTTSDRSTATWLLTPAEVIAAVGFSCNVAQETRAAFVKRFIGAHLDDQMRAFWKEHRAADATAPFHSVEAAS